MELNIDVYRSEDDHIQIVLQGLAQGEVHFPNLKTFAAFIVKSLEIIELCERSADTTVEIPAVVIEAFEDDSGRNGD